MGRARQPGATLGESGRSRGAELARAAGLGAAAGLRTFTPGAALTFTRKRSSSHLVRLTGALALGELVADKLPRTPSRLEPHALVARAASGGLAGAIVAGAAGSALAAAAALAGAYAGYHARLALGRRSGWPDPICALPEDAIAIALAWSAARR